MERKVEIEEIDFGFCLIHVFYMVLFCGYIDLMGAYRIKRKIVELIRWLFWGQNKYLPNLFTYYEQDLPKLVLLMDYYNNVYQGHYEKW